MRLLGTNEIVASSFCDLCELAGGTVERLAIVAPHPDDEVIGASSLLALREKVFVIYVTQGAPGLGNKRDVHAADRFKALESADLRKQINGSLFQAIHNPGSYAKIRRRETEQVLRFCEIPLRNAFWLDFCDQRTSYELDRIAAEIGRVLSRIQPDAILAPPYEGGHPDHDATALAVATVCTQKASCRRLEMLAYHNREGRLESDCFLTAATEVPERRAVLNDEERSRKARLLAIYASQQKVLRNFAINEERFRVAPDYDFLKPPHSGQLYYDLFNWGINGSHWRECARSFLTR